MAAASPCGRRDRSAHGHHHRLPEVTFCVNGIASAAPSTQHGAMFQRLRSLLTPLHAAALLTWLAVAVSMRFMSPDRLVLGWLLLVAWLLAFLVHGLNLGLGNRQRSLSLALLLFEVTVALVLVWLDPRPGTAQVLLVIWTAQIAAQSLRLALCAVLAADVVYFLLLRDAGFNSPLTITVINFGFQLFAALCAYYASSAEQARDRLALVNADLLATRALLADSARDAERLRVARELHDVAGHKLTALTLNLRALATDPAYTGRRELVVAQQMSSELLGDIRNVVQALRDARGLDLGTALRALAAPMPKPMLALSIAHDVQVNDPAVAEAVLRLVQEALTNSARHAEAEVVRVSLRRDGDRLAVNVEDDGHVRGAIHEGNGLS
ncbi:MAG TPA: histidine kinase, partial [Lysobacter sp.]|nr:histidine kinase [Lysobacter sp.]